MYTPTADGDLTGDGVVDLADVLLGHRIVTGLHVPGAGELQRGDVAPLVNGVPASDGVFSIGDLLLIIRIVQGDLTI